MTRHAKSQAILEAAVEVLQEEHPQTLRQCTYQLVSRQVIENSRTRYQALSNLLVDTRLSGEVPWEWLEDRTRRPRTVSMWSGLGDFMESATGAYRRDVWATQPRLVEVWLEKDALSGIFEAALEPYGVTLNVGRGYDGWSSIREAACRYATGEFEGVHVLYFGDLDPSGEDMLRSLRERLGVLGMPVEEGWPCIEKVALTLEDVDRYKLPPNPTKKSDKRTKAYVKRHGDRSWELDALPVAVLRERIIQAVESHMDLEALEEVRRLEEEERARLEALAAEVRP